MTYAFTLQKPNHNMIFHNRNQEKVGSFDFNGPSLVFEGNAEESAKVLIDWMVVMFAARLKEEYQRGYEDCLTEVNTK